LNDLSSNSALLQNEDRKIWIARSGKRHGPYQESSIIGFYQEGRIFGDDLAWYSGLEDWLPIREIINLVANEETTSIEIPQADPPPISSKLHCNLMTDTNTAAYVHKDAKRKNNPPAKIAGEGKIPKVDKVRYYYNPHLDPVLRFDSTGQSDRLKEIIEKAKNEALTAEEAEILSKALSGHQPWLEWADKREHEADRGWFEVDPVALHIHERVSAQAIVSSLKRGDYQRLLFADPELEYKEAVKFYEHDVDWANRLILGDSLQVMSSLARREDMAGKVQMIYMDPPYGIKFAGNFQNEINNRNVKDKDSDLTREPEMIKAYRDTWNLGVHSYLTYLKERLIIAKELLTESGSIFLQISDENLHRVRALMDETLGADNFVCLISYSTTTGRAGHLLSNECDYILWFAKDIDSIKYNQLWVKKDLAEIKSYKYKVASEGLWHKPLTESEKRGQLTLDGCWKAAQFSFAVSADPGKSEERFYEFNGRKYDCGANRHWKTSNPEGLDRLRLSGRLKGLASQLNYIRFLEDYPVSQLNSHWFDTGSAGYSSDDPKRYVVQTDTTIIQRCLLMTTEPGDLVLDPTCGSGTTAYVAEQWGRRWITMDSSRVSTAIARQRLMTAKYDYYRLRNEQSGIEGSFKYETVPHIMLSSISRNTNLDPIFEKHEGILNEKLSTLNSALDQTGDELRFSLLGKLEVKVKEEKANSITDADLRRWLLPQTDPELITFGTASKKKVWKEAVPPEPHWREWEVPFDTDPDWPQALQDALHDYRTAWRAKMDEVNKCIADNAAQEELVDQPEVVRNITRVSGPFTVEGVMPGELSLDEGGMFGGEPEEELESGEVAASVSEETGNVHSYLRQMTKLLKQDAVRFLNNQEKKFGRLDELFESGEGNSIHAEGCWEEEGEHGEAKVAVSFGPQFGPVTSAQVEEVIRSANRKGYDEVVMAGFSFDPTATETIQECEHKNLTIHATHIRPDVNPGMDGLLKETQNNQLFTVFGMPEVEVNKDGEDYVCELKGVDVYDPVKNVITATGATKVAAWFLDADYDGRCFCISQAFFPDQKAWDKLAKTLKGAIDESSFDQFKGTVSVPFSPGRHKRIAVKVIDPRGNEVMTARTLS
jgi:adenine-specific DNA-methyltransferase